MPFSIQASPEIWHRGDLAYLCFWRKLYRCAEIGVDRGEFAGMFLDRFPLCSEYWGIDSYEPYPEMAYDRQSDYLMAVARFERNAHRARLIKADSFSASLLFKPGSLDFIYIDAAHDHESVKVDIDAWWPALSDHGILAGHDWTDQPHHAGVKQAVTEFAEANDLAIYLTAVGGYGQEECPSWMIYKSGMPGPEWRRC